MHVFERVLSKESPAILVKISNLNASFCTRNKIKGKKKLVNESSKLVIFVLLEGSKISAVSVVLVVLKAE
jgi:hypothetical protein